MRNQHVDLNNARLDDQKEVMRKIIAAGHCPFCKDNLKKYHEQPIIKEGKYWLVTTNQWPYDHTKLHFLLIYQEHATKLSELAPESGKELLELLQWIEKEYQVPGGGWAMRFGDSEYSAGSVSHIHVQFIQPDLDHPEYEPVHIKIGKDVE
jgi:diadenosine tetraphosphate (Ap4A) HIT family hydrolase